jgi:hypothetical protein
MKYLCLISMEQKQWDALPPTEQEAIVAEHFAYDETLRQRGQLLATEALQPAATATTVRVRQGRVTTTDGPFAETKEQIGGFYLVEARDLNEAIQLAGGIPSARLGSVEVRPVWELPPPGGGSTA